MSEPKVGGVIWVYDVNRRVYAKDQEGRSVGSPIWRDHWREVKIASETSRSWVSQFGDKYPKKRDYWQKRYCAFSQDEIDELEWEQAHAHQIRMAVYNMTTKNEETLAKLKAIGEIIGYKPEAPHAG